MEQLKRLFYKLSGGFTLLPFYFAINIINVCNRKCSFCPYHSPTLTENEHLKWFKAQPENIDPLFLAYLFIFWKIAFKFCNHISITGKGEPMLHPNFLGIVRLVNDLKVPFSLTTNGDKLTGSMQKSLLELENLKEIRISVYDHQTATYWIDLQRRSKLPIKLFNQFGRHYNGMDDGYKVYVEGAKGHNVPKDFNNKPCRTPFSFLTLNTDGSIVPCYSFNPVGEWTDSFWNVYNGAKIRKFRRDALRLKAEHSDCKNCGVNL